MTVGERLHKIRKQQGISQEELGKRLMVSRQTISLWETDQTLPTIDNLMKLKDIYSVSIDYLLCDDLAGNNADKTPPTEKYSFTYNEQELKSVYSHINKSTFVKSYILMGLFVVAAFMEAYADEMLLSGIALGFGIMVFIGIMKMYRRSKTANRIAFNNIMASEYHFDFYDLYFTINILKNNEVALYHKVYYHKIERVWTTDDFYIVSVAGRLYMIKRDPLTDDSVVIKSLGKINSNKRSKR